MKEKKGLSGWSRVYMRPRMNGSSGHGVAATREKKSLLGYDDPDADALLQSTHEEMRCVCTHVS